MNFDTSAIIEPAKKAYASKMFPIYWLMGFVLMVGLGNDIFWIVPGIGGFIFFLIKRPGA